MLPANSESTSRTIIQSRESIATHSRGFHLGHRPGLDGLRGLAILLVIFVHAGLLPTTFGFIGVDLFFVLSGFLITCLLIEEWDQTGRISLKNFYIRRGLRLLPALLAVLSVFVTVSAFTRNPREFHLDVKEALAALFYYTNWANIFDLIRSDYIGHMWSLSIEEQFYILWPAILLSLLRFASRKSLLQFILLGATISWLTRVLLFLGTTAGRERFFFGLDTRADSLLLGCAVGVALTIGVFRDPAKVPRFALYAGGGGACFACSSLVLDFRWLAHHCTCGDGFSFRYPRR